MTTLCLCDINEHDLRVFAEIASAGRVSAGRAAPLGGCSAEAGWTQVEGPGDSVSAAEGCSA